MVPQEEFTQRVTIIYADYYKDFKCKCGECRKNCCNGWKVSLSDTEFTRLGSVHCEARLRARLTSALAMEDYPEPQLYAYLKKGCNGSCMLLDEDGLCAVHRGLGEDMLPSVCRLFPRSVKTGSMAELVCSAGCEKTVELLMRSTDPLNFVSITRDYSGTIPQTYHDAIQRDIMRCSAMSVMRCRSLSIYERFGELERQLPRRGGKSLTYDERGVYTIAKLFVTHFAETGIAIKAYGVPALAMAGSADQYAKLRKKAYSLLPDMEIYFEKLIQNHMFYEQFPFTFEDRGRLESAATLFACYAMAEFFAVCNMRDAESREDASARFVDAVAAAFRFAEHTDFYRNAEIFIASL